MRASGRRGVVFVRFRVRFRFVFRIVFLGAWLTIANQLGPNSNTNTRTSRNPNTKYEYDQSVRSSSMLAAAGGS